MTENRISRLILCANTDSQASVADDPHSGASETLAQVDTEFRDPVIREELYDSTSSSEIGPLMEDPDTPTKTSAHELEELRNESRTTIAQGASSSSPTNLESSPLPRSPEPSSSRSSPSSKPSSELRALRDEQAQEQARVEYLQGVGLELASTRRSADHEKLSRTPSADSSEDEALRQSLDSTRQGLQKLKLCKIERRSTEHSGPDVSMPSPTSLRSKVSFRARRTREGANWFTGSHASKTLSYGFEPPEGLAESLPSRKNGSLRRHPSRSASPHLRNNRLPPGYAQPHEQPLFVGSTFVPDREVVGEMIPIGHRLSLLPSLDASPERRIAAPVIPDPDEEADQCIPLIIPRTPPPDLTIDTTMSSALPQSGEPSNRESLFSEVMKDVDGGARPDLPPKSPVRSFERNSALLSHRGSVVFPISEPLAERDALTVKSKPNQPRETSWTTTGVLAIFWAMAFALTVFGVARASPLDRHPANHGGRIARFTSAQGVSRSVPISRDRSPVAQLFFALWWGCLSAVELSLALFYAIAIVCHHLSELDGGVQGEEKSWKQETLTASGLALRLVLVGALGTAAASGILVASWT